MAPSVRVHHKFMVCARARVSRGTLSSDFIWRATVSTCTADPCERMRRSRSPSRKIIVLNILTRFHDFFLGARRRRRRRRYAITLVNRLALIEVSLFPSQVRWPDVTACDAESVRRSRITGNAVWCIRVRSLRASDRNTRVDTWANLLLLILS